MKQIGHYLSLIKFGHTIFALPFAFVGFFLAFVEQQHDSSFWLQKFVLVLLCMVFVRSAAMAFNRYLDRHFDALNPRTAVREVPAGVIKPSHALAFTIITSLLFVATTWFINPLCFVLSFVALFVVLFYSYTKRFTALCHLVLGVGLSLAPIGAYLAITATFDVLPVLFSLLVFTWVSGFDIIYALQDEQFDKSQKLHSIPVALGPVNALRVSSALHILSAIIIFCIGYVGNFHPIYWMGAYTFGGLLYYQHSIVKPHDLKKVNVAFANTNGVASVVFAILTITAILLSYY